MKLPLTITALLLASACAPKVQQICEDVYVDKLNPSVERCTDVAVEWPTFTPTWSNDNDDPDTPRVSDPDPDEPSGPADPTDPDTPDGPNPDDPSDPTGPETPDEPDRPRSEKAKSNNGWGNGDDAAPGRSRDRNNAENGERTQRNHGRSNRN